MNECNRCKAAAKCSAACQPGSVVCMVNRLRSGQTKADALGLKPPRYCAYCGYPLRIIDGNKRFCDNSQCTNRYEDV